ncbi:hypothetical protein cypCar_00005237, partial [Cyprinus carpio]
NSTEAEKGASLINPKELKAESVLKSLKQVVPTPSEKVSPVEGKFEQQILHTSSDAPVLDKSIKHGHRTTTVQVTLVSKCPQSAELQVHSPVHQPNTDASFSTQPINHDNEHDVTKRSSEDQAKYTEEASLSPDLPGDEGPPPPNNMAFRITKTKVQALSTGEYQQLVNSKGTDVQTVKVGSEPTLSAPEDSGFDKKPVIIIFDEPMDICQAYKRLSTIFECEEELERVLSEERIDEENEEEVEANSKSQVGQITPTDNLDQCRTENRNSGDSPASSRISSPKSRQQPAESVEKPGKPQKLQDSQRQFRQSSIPCLSLIWPSCRPLSSSQQPEGQNLTLPPQTQNGKSCSYSYSSSSSSSSYSSSSSVSLNSTSSSSSPSSPSLLSPTAMCRGGGAVHMPSFSSRKSLKASSDQAAITPASFTGNMA